MKIKNLTLFFILTILFVGFASAGYVISNPKYTETLTHSSFGESQFGFFNNEQCQEGQDFIVQIAPAGCSPAVVRSDLLEEQDVAVFCQLQAMKINPFINIKSIDSIGFQGSYPQGVRTIGFTPVYSSLGKNRQLNSLMWNNIGYVTIVLSRQAAESGLLNCESSSFGGEVCWVEGDLSARIQYDLEGGFGLKTHTFYLPTMDDMQFSRGYGQYEFFDGMGYLRAEDITSTSATIGIYSGRLESPYKEGSVSKQQYREINLNKGQESSKILLPGLDCLAGVTFKLVDIDNADVRARISVNSQIFELSEDEEFLGGSCKVTSINHVGMNQDVRIVCVGDEKTDAFDLHVTPTIILEIDGTDVEAQVGQKLYDSDDGSVYFAYADSEDDVIENTRIMLVQMPSTANTLTNTQVEEFATLARMSNSNPSGLVEVVRNAMSSVSSLGQYLIDGSSNLFLDYEGNLINAAGSSSSNAWGKRVSIKNFGVARNARLNSTIQGEYNAAVEDFDEIYSSYSGEKYPESSNLTLAENAFAQKINLADALEQKSDVDMWCKEFRERFSNSRADVSVCSDYKKISNEEISTRDVVINSDVKRISFEGVVYPTFSDYGAEVLIRMPTGERILLPMEKNRVYNLDESKNEFVRLVELDEERAYIEFNIQNKSFTQEASEFLTSNKFTIKKDETFSIGGYAFTLNNVNLKKVAKVTVNPDIGYQGTQADFSFKVGVEKRAIQLSPEKAQDLANKLNDTIQQWTDISDKMGTVVQTMKTACLATGAILTAKNLLFGAGGETIARQKVMRGEGGWDEQCRILVAREGSQYNSLDDCFMKNSDAIDNDVDNFKNAMEAQNSYIKSVEKVENTGLLGTSVVNRDDFAKDFSLKVSGSLNDNANISKNGESIDVSSVKLALQEGWEQGLYSIDDLKEIDLYTRLLQLDSDNEVYNDRFYTALKQVEINSERWSSVKVAENTLRASTGISGLTYDILIEKNDKRIEGVYDGYINSNGKIGDIPLNSFVKGVSVYGKEYLLRLRNVNTNQYTIEKVYDALGRDNVPDEESRRVMDSYSMFKQYDRSSYQNQILASEVKYYETEPYKGLPSLVPFDKENGWYAYLKQTIPVGSNVVVYDESGRVSSFYLCNVGSNNLVDFEKSSSDDVCQLIKTQSGVYNQFAGLSESETKVIVDKAVQAIYEASRAYRDGVNSVSILGETYEVGSPAVDDSGLSCTDYMSPKDCKLMFNVCDPVICPNDRCDFGGDYPVPDVVQSGIVGSLALCLPNAQEGIYVPVCLTGVKAGLDGFLSVMTAYRDCLQYNVETGQTVGVCDEIHSIYLCEFFWKQGIPLAKIAIPKLMSAVMGENVRGGSSYSNVESAWANAQDSVNFFTEYYAVNAFKAFKARSQDEVGTEVCKSFVSIAYPSGQGFLDILTEGDSPSQFNANFDEIKLTTVTSPPTSHYKVYYHIYAGKDRGAYYRVYIRGLSGSSYFQDTSSGRTIASGYVSVGDYASETVDFTAPSGYQELCVRVNEQEECGFREVTTSFASNYLKDQFLENQATTTDIKTEAECVSGSPNVYGLTNLNVQEGVSNAINPELYNLGIIRTCATNNPGIGTDPYVGTEDARWMDVGYCGSTAMRCWIDTDSIDDAMNWEVSSDQALDEITKNYLDVYASENSYLTDVEFGNYIENNITSESNLRVRIVKITNTFEKVFMNNHNAYLYLLRGEAYSEIAKLLYVDYSLSRVIPEDVSEEVSDTQENVTMDLTFVSPVYEYEDGRAVSNLCYMFFDGKWHWSPVCEEVQGIQYRTDTGMPITISGQSFEWHDSSILRTNNNLEPTDENKMFITSLTGKDYTEGINLLVDRAISESGSWISNPSVVVKEAGVIVNTYGIVEKEILQGDESGILYFVYKNNKWYYSMISLDRSSQNWKEVLDFTPQKEKRIIDQVADSFKWFNEVISFGLYDSDTEYVKTYTLFDGSKSILVLLSSMNEAQGYAYLLSSKSVFTQEPIGSGEEVFVPETDVFDLDEMMSQYSGLRALMNAVNNRDGTRVVEEEACAIDNQGQVNCYTGLMVVYGDANVGINCVYSALNGESFSFDGQSVSIGSSGPQDSSGNDVYVVNSVNACINVGLSEKDKLNLLKPGAQIDLITVSNNAPSPHSVMFVNWIDRENNIARIFDTGHFGGISRTYSLSSVDLSDDSRPVYKIRYPTFYERVDVSSSVVPGSGVPLSQKNSELISASRNGDLDKVKVLIEDGANVESKDEGGWTPLMSAVAANNLDIVKYLIEKGANVNSPALWTPLMLSVDKGYLEIAKYLIGKGANIEATGSDGTTVLMYSAFSGNVDVVKYLVEQGAGINAIDNDGKTVLDNLEEFGGSREVEIINYLRSIGANSASVNVRENLIKSLQSSGDIRSDLADNDMEVLLKAKVCEECGDVGRCNDYECDAISLLIGKTCEFSRHWTGIGGDCVEVTSDSGVESYSFSNALSELDSGVSVANILEKMRANNLITQEEYNAIVGDFSASEFRDFLRNNAGL